MVKLPYEHDLSWFGTCFPYVLLKGKKGDCLVKWIPTTTTILEGHRPGLHKGIMFNRLQFLWQLRLLCTDGAHHRPAEWTDSTIWNQTILCKCLYSHSLSGSLLKKYLQGIWIMTQENAHNCAKCCDYVLSYVVQPHRIPTVGCWVKATTKSHDLRLKLGIVIKIQSSNHNCKMLAMAGMYESKLC